MDKTPYYCPVCKKSFKSQNGLQGHFRFKHGTNYNTGRPAKETVFTRAIRRDIDKKRLGEIIIKEVNKMEKELESLENEKKKEESMAEKPVEEKIGELCHICVEKGKVTVICNEKEAASAIKEKIEREGILVKPREVEYEETSTEKGRR